jgi:uncharacterized protein (TIGR03435 family)
MWRVNIPVTLVFLTSCAAFAQTTGATPTFEVASVKPASPPNMNGGRGGRGGRGSPGQVMFTNASMTQILMSAYGVKGYQISGPSWMETERYDIVAKLPEGATRADSPPMLQNLLAERFKLSVHREKKDLPIYALVVARNGLKMKESAAATAPKDGDVAPPIPAALSERKMGPDGFPIMLAGGRGQMIQLFSPSGARMKVTMETMVQFADLLSNQLDRPVMDQTGLTKNYDFILDYAPEPGGGRGPMGMALPAPPPGDGGTAAEPDAGPTLLVALQNQLGLKLEPKKGRVGLLVVDRIEKTPTEN